MKALKVLLALLMSIVFASAHAQTTISRIDIPVATYFYVPIGDRDSDIRNDLRLGFRPNTTSTPTQLFPGFNGVDNNGWYIYTDFNRNVNYDGTAYTSNHYHPGEDWNGNGGASTDLGQPVYAASIGRVIYTQTSQSGFGNMVQVVHFLPDGEFVLSFYAHLQQIMVNENDLVYPTTQIGTVGNSGTGDAHLHFEIRKQTFIDLSDPYSVSLKNTAPYTPTAWPGTDTTFITNNYYDPTDFIKLHSVIGRSSPMQSSPYELAFEQAFNGNGGHVGLGIPFGGGPGGIYLLYYTPNSTILTQDFRQYQTQFEARLMRNPYNGLVYPLYGAIANFWDTNYGAPFSKEIVAPLANSPDGSHNNLASATFEVVGQKFGNPNGTRKAIMHNPANGYTNHIPMGVYAINYSHYPSSYPGEHQWYIIVDSNPANDIPWPAAGVEAPTGDWWTVSGQYNFTRHAANGSRVGGFSASINEGNHQFADPTGSQGIQTPQITQSTVNSSNWVDLVWTNVSASPYAVYRDNIQFSQVNTTYFTDQTVVPGTTYIYSVSGNGTQESAPVSVTIPEIGSGGGGGSSSGIVVTSPPGGIRYDLGSTILISWSGEENVQIEVSRDNGQTWSVLVVAIGMTSYYWQDIPGPESAQCRIRISENGNPSRSALSPGTFIIGNPPQPPEWPKTVEAETLSGIGLAVPDGKELTSTGDRWYVYTDPWMSFPNAGLLEIEVVAKAGGQVNGVWPQLFVKVGSQSSAAQTMNSTSYQTYLFKNFSLSQGGDQSVELNLSETTRSVSGHSITIDKVIVHYVFSGIPARLNMTCNGIGATVELYNVESGYFTQTLLPCSNFPVQGGEYSLRIQKNGYFVWNSTYRFTPDVTSTLHADLEQVPIELVLSSVTLNSGFESGLANWSATEANGNTVAASSDAFSGSTSANMSVPQAGEAWQAGLYQTVSVTNQQLYMVRFKAKASVSRSIIATLSSDAPSWTTYNFWEQIPVTAQWQEYSRSFSAQNVINGTDPAALLLFQAGHESGDIYIDDVEFGLAPLSDRTTEQLLVVEDFEHGSLGSWMVYNSPGNNVGGSNTGHYSGEYAARFDVTNPGTDGDLSMRHLVESDPNSQYRVSFWAISTTGNRPITISFGEEGGSWAIYGLYETPQVTTQWQSFEYAFLPTTGDPNAIILFKVGQSAGTLFIDDIVVRKIDPANSLSNNSFENGTLGGWNVAAASGNTIIADPHAGNDGIFSARFDIAQNGSFADLSIRQGVSVLASHAYTFSFWAKNTQNRTIEIVCSQEGGSWTTNGLYANTPLEVSGWAYYTYEFTPDFDDANGTIIIKGGQTQGAFWIDGLRFEDSGLSKQALPESEHTASIPAAYALYQCYPNPFNPETTIRYALKEPTFVRLTVYTVLGQLVRVLVDVPQETAGMKEVIWDGRNSKGEFVASGTYFYRLEVNGFTDVKKMAVVK